MLVAVDLMSAVGENLSDGQPDIGLAPYITRSIHKPLSAASSPRTVKKTKQKKKDAEASEVKTRLSKAAKK